MTIERNKEWQFDVMCDGDKCNEFIETESRDFADALEIVKEKGWKIRKVNGEWQHFCPDEDVDGLNL